MNQIFMVFDPNNKIVKLCADGMGKEAEGKHAEASLVFEMAWNEATNYQEKFIAAHYVARHQGEIHDKLKWDLIALNFALQVEGPFVGSYLPSLYLNVAKCYADLENLELAKVNYDLAFFYAEFLPEDGYGAMIKSGIVAGIARVSGNVNK